MKGRGRRRSAWVACCLLAACGGDDTETLTPEEELQVSSTRLAFTSTILDGSMYGKTLRGVDQLIRLCRDKPDAIYESGDGDLTMRQVVEDGANTLQEYRPELAAQLDRVADNGCE